LGRHGQRTAGGGGREEMTKIEKTNILFSALKILFQKLKDVTP
jgi:hypothetical protein